MVTKKELRLKAKSTRASLDIEKISKEIVKNILSLDAYKKAKNVMIFYPLEYEINLTKLLEDKNKNFYLPKIEGENLVVCPYILGDTLITSKFKTKEPVSKKISDTSILDIIFVPALMVDKTFNRLGYGGGFYDRFLANQSKKIIKISVAASILTINEIPADSFDERIDIIINEQKVLIK